MSMSEPTETSVRAEVRAWLEANWSPDHGLVEWRNKLIDSGWGVPSWPKDWFGRELPVAPEKKPLRLRFLPRGPFLWVR